MNKYLKIKNTTWKLLHQLVALSLPWLFFRNFVSAGSELNSDKDFLRNWKIEGYYQYYRSGSLLSLIQDILPDSFDYYALRHAQGIWAVLPFDDMSVVSGQTTALFKFSSVNQVIFSVDITYCMGGEATIELKTALEEPPLFTIKPSDPLAINFVTTNIPMSASKKFVVEANVTAGDDFILIYRIKPNYRTSPGKFSEITTSGLEEVVDNNTSSSSSEKSQVLEDNERATTVGEPAVYLLILAPVLFFIFFVLWGAYEMHIRRNYLSINASISSLQSETHSANAAETVPLTEFLGTETLTYERHIMTD